MRYPLFFDLCGKKILFVGGGKVAERRINALKDTGAVITVITKQASDSLISSGCRIIIKDFDEQDIDLSYSLVFACTDSKGTNYKAGKRAKELKIPVNLSDNPDMCDFHMPSVIETDEFVMSISSKDSNPIKSKSLRKKIELLLKNSE